MYYIKICMQMFTSVDTSVNGYVYIMTVKYLSSSLLSLLPVKVIQHDISGPGTQSSVSSLLHQWFFYIHSAAWFRSQTWPDNHLEPGVPDVIFLLCVSQ